MRGLSVLITPVKNGPIHYVGLYNMCAGSEKNERPVGPDNTSQKSAWLISGEKNDCVKPNVAQTHKDYTRCPCYRHGIAVT